MEDQNTQTQAELADIPSTHLLDGFSEARPKQPGWYWTRLRTKDGYLRPPRIIEVKQHYGNKKLITFWGVKPIPVEKTDALWCGPLLPPASNVKAQGAERAQP